MLFTCSFEILIDMGIYMSWNDTRLNISACEGILDPYTKEQIWLPNPYLFYLSFNANPFNELKSEYLTAKSGVLHWWLESNFGLKCTFDFTFYPFDQHECRFKLSSSSFPVGIVNYSSNGVVKSRYGMEHPIKYDVGYTEMTTPEDLNFVGGNYNWSTCGFYIKLDRKWSTNIINFYLPSMLIVIITFCRYVKKDTFRRFIREIG